MNKRHVKIFIGGAVSCLTIGIGFLLSGKAYDCQSLSSNEINENGIITTSAKTETIPITETTKGVTTSETLSSKKEKITTTLSITTTIFTTISTEQEQTETSIQASTVIEKPDNCLIIGGDIIPVVHAPATQEMVNRYDVVEDEGIWTTDCDKYFFGHDTRSFACLLNVEMGNIITLIEDGIEMEYEVFRCETGIVTEDELNIKSTVDETYFVNTDLGYETIRLITCIPLSPKNYRRVVIGKKID